MTLTFLCVILGLITNGLTSLIGTSGKKAGNLLIGKDFLEKWELEKTSLEPLLHTAISNVAETFHWEGPATEEVLASFLLLPETQEIVRQIYSMRLERGKKQNHLASMQQVFLTSLTLFVNSFPHNHMLSENDLHDTSDFLFNLLLRECDFVLENANDKGVLAAHEAKSAMRHHVIASEIEAIHKKLNFLVSRESLDYKSISEFEKKYRSQVGSHHSSITPPNFDSAHKLPIDEIFVTPRVCTIPRTKKEEQQMLTMEAFFTHAFRAVLLGNPGGGKSTLSLKLCHDLATYYPDFEFSGRKQLTPILIILREYGADKKERKCSILEFIETEAKATYQLTPPPSRAFEYLLLSGRAMVIFDGLDELLDTSYRQEIRDDVEAFCRYYPSVPVLITSREVGYEQAPLNEKMFETYMLAEFDDKQVKEYVEKWFNVEDREIAVQPH